MLTLLFGFDQGQSKGRVSHETAWGAHTYKGRQVVTGIIGNMVLVNSLFPHAEEFLRKLSAPSKIFSIPVLGSENLNNIDSKRRQMVGLPGTPDHLPARGSNISRAGRDFETLLKRAVIVYFAHFEPGCADNALV